MLATKNFLHNILLNAQILNETQLFQATEHSKKTGNTLLESICALKIVEKEELYFELKNALEIQYGTTFTDLSVTVPDFELLNVFSKEIMLSNKFLPIKKTGNVFTFAMVDPSNIVAENEIKYRLKDIKDLAIKKTIILEDDLNNFIAARYSKSEEEKNQAIEQDADEILSSFGIDVLENASENIDIADLSDSAEEAPIIQLANSILGIAIKRGVSDIHIEPGEKELVVRFRQDGVLTIYKTIPKKVQNALISRYKIMADLDISERRLPQDGRIRVKMVNKVIDFRVSTLPSKFGEKIVMRILDKSSISLGLDKIITDKETLATVREMITRPFGIIFVTGPTGSGKTTTLYSALSERNTPEVNISTAEDPIEYDLPGITQSEVNKTIGLDFARILRAFLRQDPDIMLVGETRDKETAKIAIEAALTGHLVFTTLHTNDAPGAVMRLEEMDVEPFLISSSTIGIIAQRLLRKICPHCKEEYIPDAEVTDYLSIKSGEKYYKGRGCEKCSGTGYKGRIGAYEVLKVNDNIRDLIAKGSNTAVLREAAKESGMRTLLEYSLNLAKEGHTTLDEVIRVTFSGM
jgi:type IV pilus assembly protein PilB